MDAHQNDPSKICPLHILRYFEPCMTSKVELGVSECGYTSQVIMVMSMNKVIVISVTRVISLREATG